MSDDTDQSYLSKNHRSDGHELGTECDVESCSERVIGLDDGWEYSRGIVCHSCIKYRHQHHHWPDEDSESCRECILDDGGAVHDCPETSVDVLLRPGDDCPNCGFELATADGGQQPISTGRRCDTDGCHRQATHLVTYNVYAGEGVREERRDSCEPCIHAMQFRETFTWSTDEWSTRKVEGAKQGGDRR